MTDQTVSSTQQPSFSPPANTAPARSWSYDFSDEEALLQFGTSEPTPDEKNLSAELHKEAKASVYDPTDEELKAQSWNDCEYKYLQHCSDPHKLVARWNELHPEATEAEKARIKIPFGGLNAPKVKVTKPATQAPKGNGADKLKQPTKEEIARVLAKTGPIQEEPKLPKHFKPLSRFNALSNPAWLVKGLLEQNEIGVLVGDSGSGKTLHLINLTLHVVNGWPYMGLKTTQCGVIYILGEGNRAFYRRIRAWELAYNRQQEYDYPYLTVEVPYALNDNKSIEDLKKHIKDTLKFYPAIPHWLIVVDTLNRNMESGVEENTNTGMGKAINNVINSIKPLSVTILIAHHYNKKGEMRGFTGLKNNIDLMIDCACKSEGDEKHYIMSLDKVRDGDNSATYTFIGQEVPLGILDEDGEEVTSYTVQYLSTGTKASKSTDKPLLENDGAYLQLLVDLITPVAKAVEKPLTEVRFSLRKWNDQAKAKGLFPKTKQGNDDAYKARGRLLDHQAIDLSEKGIVKLL